MVSGAGFDPCGWFFTQGTTVSTAKPNQNPGRRQTGAQAKQQGSFASCRRHPQQGPQVEQMSAEDQSY